MKPEREAEIRDTQARMEARAPLIGLHAAGARLSLPMSRDLLAEIDRLRALPVIATCGECGACRLIGRPDDMVYVCTRDDPPFRRTDPRHEPPSWCPFRGAR